MNHPLATTITLLILAQPKSQEFEYNVYTVLAHLIDLEGWPDERKADLYARLAEKLNAGMRMVEMQKAVQQCLEKNERWFHHG